MAGAVFLRPPARCGPEEANAWWASSWVLGLPSGKVSVDAERNACGQVDKFWAVALACQKERMVSGPRTGEIGVRVLG